MSHSIHVLGPGDAAVLERVAPEVFDEEVNQEYTAEFLADPRHHLVVALDEGVVVGFASGVHYIHPDKPPELFINEVGVAPTHQRRGIARQLLQGLLAQGRAVGCREAWVGTDVSNASARALYAAAGGAESPEPFIMYSFDLDER
jgi:aminoglycoside 6'-N-acetyltransferase I